MKIILFKQGGMGDVLMTTPLVRLLRKKYPEAVMHYWAGSQSVALLEKNPNLDKIYAFDEGIFQYNRIGDLLKLRKRIASQRYDKAFVLDSERSKGLLLFLSGIKDRKCLRKGLWNNNSGTKKRHHIDAFLGLAGSTESSKDMELFLSKTDEDVGESIFANQRLQKETTLGIVVGAWQDPNISPSSTEPLYNEVLGRLTRDFDILFLGGHEDKGLNQRILRKTKNRKVMIDLAGCLSLRETAAVMKRCNFIICNDSWALQMAAAVNDRVLAICAHPDVYAPLHNQSAYICKPDNRMDDAYGKYRGSPDIQASDILETIEKRFGGNE